MSEEGKREDDDERDGELRAQLSKSLDPKEDL